MANLYVIIATCIVVTMSSASADLFSSISHLAPLIKTHQSVIDELERYIYLEIERIDVLNKFLSNFKKEQEMMLEAEDYVRNPINTYTLITRLTADLGYIDYYVNLKTEFKKDPELLYPGKDDLEGAATALWRLQRMYALNVSELAAGKLEGRYNYDGQLLVENSLPMSVSDSFEVGRVVYDFKDYKNTIAWMNEALKKSEYEDSEDSFHFFDVAHILDYLRHAYHGVGDFQSAITYTNKLAELQPEQNYTESLHRYETLSKQVVKPLHVPDQDLGFLEESDKQKYRLLCRGDVPIPDHKRKRLYCYYQRNSPFLLLAPFKVEQLHRDPEVLLFYDVMSQHEITHMQQSAEPELRRAMVRDNNPASYRICKLAWFRDDESPVARKVSRRIEDMTGLNNDFSEAFQATNYGIGGHYDPHFDFLGDTEHITATTGNRIATVLFYMSDVEQGGATVFTKLKITVFPKKRSAIVWYNMLPSGQPDYRTNHAACPVLRGSKWVFIKWLHEFGQEFRRPCNLDFEENKSKDPRNSNIDESTLSLNTSFLI